MKSLVVEDDFSSRLLLEELLKKFGEVHSAVNGREAVDLCGRSVRNDEIYDLICLDIMMPEMDGQEALRKIRALEDEASVPFSFRAKILMTTALGDVKSVMGAYYQLCDGYLVKPFTKSRLHTELERLGLI